MFEPALGRLALVCGPVAHAVASLSVRGRDAVCVDRLVCWLALCDRWRSTDRLRFHSVCSSGFGGAGGGFSDR